MWKTPAHYYQRLCCRAVVIALFTVGFTGALPSTAEAQKLLIVGCGDGELASWSGWADVDTVTTSQFLAMSAALIGTAYDVVEFACIDPNITSAAGKAHVAAVSSAGAGLHATIFNGVNTSWLPGTITVSNLDSCGDNVQVIAPTHPIVTFANPVISNADLSNVGCALHGSFTSFSSEYTSIARSGDSGLAVMLAGQFGGGRVFVDSHHFHGGSSERAQRLFGSIVDWLRCQGVDSDGDGRPDGCDTCPSLSNPDQSDADHDGVGDACNDDSDADGDEFADSLDNCPAVANGAQTDTDGDGIGDACNDAVDADNDEYAAGLDNCASIFNPTQEDSDKDSIGDACEAQIDITAITPVSGSIQRAEITLTSPTGVDQYGSLTVHSFDPPTSIDLTILATCGSDALEVFLNDALVATISLNQASNCICEAPIENAAVVDGTALAEAWGPANNVLRVRKVGTGTGLAWVKATLNFASSSSETVCALDSSGGNCTEPNACNAGLEFNEISGSVPSATAGPILASATYSDSTLPQSLDIATVPAGQLALVASTAIEGFPAIDSLTISLLRTSCGFTNPTHVYLNDVLATTLDADATCICTPGSESVTITDPGVLAAWNPSGNNTVRVQRDDGHLFSWVRVKVTNATLGTDLETCVFDSSGGNCDSSNTCSSFVTGPLDLSTIVGDRPQVDVFAFVKTTETTLVINNTPPSVSAPANQTLEATGPGGAAAIFSASGSDAEDGPLTPICTPASGATFPLGATTVTCTVTDSGGLSDEANFVITVVDTTPPVLTLPTVPLQIPQSAAGAAVTFVASAIDVVSGSITPVCNPPSGSVFAIGPPTTVSCTATDGAGNVANGNFTITVACCDLGVTVAPSSARRRGTVTLSAFVRNFSAVNQPVTVEFEVTTPYLAKIGSFPVTIPAGTNRTFNVPFRIPSNATLGVYTISVKTTTAAGVIERTATLTVTP